MSAIGETCVCIRGFGVICWGGWGPSAVTGVGGGVFNPQPQVSPKVATGGDRYEANEGLRAAGACVTACVSGGEGAKSIPPKPGVCAGVPVHSPAKFKLDQLVSQGPLR